MFLHNFKYSFKVLWKSKELVFWTFVFPIILGTLFYFAFSNIEKSEKFQLMDIAIVTTEQWQGTEEYQEIFHRLSDETQQECLFHIQYVSQEEEAETLLAQKQIIGYFLLEEDAKVVVASNGMYETIFQSIVQEIMQKKEMISFRVEQEISEKIMKEDFDYNSLYQKVGSSLEENTVNIKDISSKHLSYTMIEFYTLIAMACLYGGLLGMVSVNHNLPNMSKKGRRIAVSPIAKIKIVMSSVLASFIVQLIGIFLLLFYTIVVLKVDFGSHFWFVMLLTFLGSLAGLSFGIFLATFVKGNDNLKTGILISFTMLGCFFSGMMGITMKYVIDKNIPIINAINPANMITDGFYSLYYYDTFDRYWQNVIFLLLFSLLMIFLSALELRRQKYDSI